MTDSTVSAEVSSGSTWSLWSESGHPSSSLKLVYQLHLAGLSLSNTKQYLERLGVERIRTAIHNWIQKADLQSAGDGAPNQIAVDETVIRINDQRHWRYAAVDPEPNEILHVRLPQARTTQLTVLFLRELSEKQQVEQATFLIDKAHYLKAALERLGLRFSDNSPRKSEQIRTYFS